MSLLDCLQPHRITPQGTRLVQPLGEEDADLPPLTRWQTAHAAKKHDPAYKARKMAAATRWNNLNKEKRLQLQRDYRKRKRDKTHSTA